MNALTAFWNEFDGAGIHPDDRPFLGKAHCIDWSLEQARDSAPTFDSTKHLHNKLHVNLLPQPFVGNLDRSLVFVLLANPGFAVTDYQDELGNADHASACCANLRQTGIGFYPLLPPSLSTGAGKYWRGRLRTLVADLAKLLNISEQKASRIVVERFAVVEAGAYHSKSAPGDWYDELPSSQAAKSFVQRTLLPRADSGEIMLFVWRKASFWAVPPARRGVLYRRPETAQLKNLSVPERGTLVQFLAERVRSDVR
jgi:hypothetical protein